jgi:hypothetical protein
MVSQLSCLELTLLLCALWCVHDVRFDMHAARRSFRVCAARPVTTVYVDTMALRFISSTKECLVHVTNDSPSTFVETVSGSICVDAIGVAGLNVCDVHHRWHYLELPDAHVCSGATVELYPVQLHSPRTSPLRSYTFSAFVSSRAALELASCKEVRA